MISDERAWVRDLARQVADIANDETRMGAIIKRWRDVNALRKPDRAPVWCKPVGCWREILPPESFKCETPYLRGWEVEFRRILHKRDIDDDTPVEPYFVIDAAFDVEPLNRWGVDIGRHAATGPGGAWSYDPPLKTEADFDNLRLPKFTFNEQKTNERFEKASDLLGDILPVVVRYDAPLSATLGTAAADLRGLERIMMDMISEPDLMHRLMAHLRDSTLNALDSVEATGRTTPNTYGAMYCSDPIGMPDAAGRFTFKNSWCAANSQEFDQVSPRMWESFCLNYQKPIFERFGRVAYGCCENLTKKIKGVLSIPNLRIFVCSAWSNLDAIMDAVGNNYTIMWRQKASDVVFPKDSQTIVHDLENGMKKLKGSVYQVVLRELETLNGKPDRLHVWTRNAKEIASKHP